MKSILDIAKERYQALIQREGNKEDW